ncbi:MAG: zinc-binding dehydrogenase [Eubacteriales bacterium]
MVLAAKLVGPGELAVQDFPYTKPDANALTLRVEMCGICGTDKHTFKGEITQYGGKAIQYPTIPGHEILGRILEIGSRDEPLTDFNGSRLREGDRVVVLPNIGCGKCYFCNHGFPPYFCPDTLDYGNLLNCSEAPYLFGGWSEVMYLIPGTTLFKVPESMPPEIAVLTEVFAVTASLDKAKEFSTIGNEGFRFADTVLVQGAGPIGIAHLVKAQMLGAGQVIVIDKSDYRLSLAKKLGADHVLNIEVLGFEKVLKSVTEITNGLGADVAIECAGEPEAVVQGLEFLRTGGMYLVVGVFVAKGDISFDPHRLILAKNARIIGIGGDGLTSYGPSIKMLEKWARILPIKDIVTHRFHVSEAKAAIQQALDLNSCKVVFEP